MKVNNKCCRIFFLKLSQSEKGYFLNLASPSLTISLHILCNEASLIFFIWCHLFLVIKLSRRRAVSLSLLLKSRSNTLGEILLKFSSSTLKTLSLTVPHQLSWITWKYPVNIIFNFLFAEFALIFVRYLVSVS